MEYKDKFDEAPRTMSKEVSSSSKEDFELYYEKDLGVKFSLF